ncbi:MAG: ACP S-malonyltransferase [Deltaproteobacteria bacterium]|nr:ACP S-malonyltransferase [Deltaproteobacteria bacterium]
MVFVFPGQGSQAIGMGKALYGSYRAAKEVWDEADDILNMGLRRMSFEGTEGELGLTENTQPALLTASFAALRVIEEEVSFSPAFVAGHSLGEYTALVAAGVLEFPDALRLVRIRGKLMQEAVPDGAGAMSAIIGLDAETLGGICMGVSRGDALVVCANINGPVQVVISGHAGAVLKASEEARKRGAKRVVPLSVSAPSHSPLMEGAAKKFDRELSKVRLGDFRIPLVTNVEGTPCREKEKIRELLRLQLTSPVRWMDVIKRMRREGVSVAIEIGPGSVLSGLIRRIEKDMKAFNFSAPEDIGAIKDFFGWERSGR